MIDDPRFLELARVFLEGRLTTTEQEELRRHPDWVKELSRQTAIDSLLRAKAEGAVEVPAFRRSNVRRLWFGVAAAAALIAIGVLLWPRPAAQPPVVAETTPKPPVPKPKPLPPAIEPVRERTAIPVPKPPQPPPRPPEEKPPAPSPEPPPPPPPAPAPTVEPPAPPKKEPAPRTETAVATLETVQGMVRIVRGGAKVDAAKGLALLTGQGLETEGPTGWAVLRFPDGTVLELWGDTAIVEAADGPGKRFTVAKGTVVATVIKQTAPMIFSTPQAEAVVLGTTLRIDVSAETKLSVLEGKVKLTRLSDQKSLEVVTGHYAIAAAGVEFLPKPLQDKKAAKGHPGVDQRKVDLAVQRGVEWLVAHPDAWSGGMGGESLVLWTFLHAGMPDTHPAVQRLLKGLVDADITSMNTYAVSLTAMILEELDRVKHQSKIQECAQWLVDNQNTVGHWGYGRPTPFLGEISRKPVATGTKPKTKTPTRPEPGKRVKPDVLQKVSVRQRRLEDGVGGDNSNTQYALLGLRACLDAGVLIPPEVVALAEKWLRTGLDDRTNAHAKGFGWTYGPGTENYGSMTAGALGSLIICDYLSARPWIADKDVTKGLKWLTDNWSVAKNPGAEFDPDKVAWHYYYLYALERVGALYGTAQIGSHDWYREGAIFLIEAQAKDGSWSNVRERITFDTCFAVLFLRRATPQLSAVASVDRYHPPDKK